jgi:hypothetical protein
VNNNNNNNICHFFELNGTKCKRDNLKFYTKCPTPSVTNDECDGGTHSDKIKRTIRAQHGGHSHNVAARAGLW